VRRVDKDEYKCADSIFSFQNIFRHDRVEGRNRRRDADMDEFSVASQIRHRENGRLNMCIEAVTAIKLTNTLYACIKLTGEIDYRFDYIR